MTFDEIVTAKIKRLAEQKKRNLRNLLYATVVDYCASSYTDPLGIDVNKEIDSLVDKLTSNIEAEADREITEKMMRLFE